MNQEPSIIELEHTIGFSGKIPKSVHVHSNGEDFLYISGACIVVTNLMNPHKQHFLRGHDNQISCLALSNNGLLVASGQIGDNSDVIIWDFEKKKPKFRLSEHDYEVVVVQFSHNDQLLFSCGNAQDKKLFVWDTSNGYIVASCIIFPEKITTMRWGGYAKDIKLRDTAKYQFATAGNKQICLWKLDSKTGQIEHEFINTGSVIREYKCLEYSKNREDYLFAGTTSGDFLCFQIKNKLLICVITVAALGVQSIQAININHIIVGCGNGQVNLYKTNDNQIDSVASTQLFGSVNSISCMVSGQETMCATDKGFIYRVRNDNLQKVLHCENHTDSVLFLAYPPGISDKFASCSEDGSIRLWNIEQDYLVVSRCFASNAGHPLCLTHNDEIVLSGWQDGKIRMFNSENGNLIWQIDNAHKGGVQSICLGKNLKFFCSGGLEGEVRVWEMRSREMISHLKEHTHKVSKVKLIGDQDAHVLSSSKDRACKFIYYSFLIFLLVLCWDLKNEKRINAHIQRMGGINSFDTTQDHQIAITTGQDRQITYWNLNQSNPTKIIHTSKDNKADDECMCLHLSNNGKYFATGGSQQVVKIWEFSTGKLVGEGKGHSGTINTVCFSFDDKQIISGGCDGNIFVWNIFD
ncbi:WD40 repeat protein [Ichthyophthirius multifiliis]|uniref:WD40 repeat protein n=1 Tax=Ichthyophthirius multifiliis TaxID=5932 RepID=G0QUW6_ICHMU|nr:WD40 repeat protein [Ichthyophthirius multifiliis]EGR30971.1 WD40 repeat protein [Ichthyophthirius multifiliis]|eukprot:XP_004034457.1 WD40 repeat protein [Ichthyophthirius multifiliis]